MPPSSLAPPWPSSYRATNYPDWARRRRRCRPKPEPRERVSDDDDVLLINPASASPRFCMLIFLPDKHDGLRDLLRLAATEPGFVTRCVPEDLQEVIPCLVPKFKFAFGFDATDPLRSLGLAAPFDPLAADLSGAVASCTPALEEGLYVSSVEQICGVEVGEEGTTAVGVLYEPSSPTYSPGQPPPPPPMSFVADRPFVFAVVEYNKAEVLFLGHVVDPAKET
ncbi:putative non-inhibitory serpin-Z11 [Brachypodium distachyon]|nr:putative non-inhibitory serpin-Z11 [Brachypodium distachyon]|eukprot:XP_024311834.1 putative non-inhibitory serpin-Z11 [Brachypodium distachyon]